ncbi:MAG TPA: glucose 1-dehydrogenase [Pyrinomonadaceae bacterium]|jgi:NAD(P)-dependent dehydrogenase (short-subunit alcohol dehydrogenase family)|nr:glucose 1-dehydrogenase [Pyrinomonadaceae bacterium]
MEGKVVVITGASSGIGRSSARLFAGHGATVVAVGRNEKELKALKKELGKSAGTIKPHLADMAEMSQLERIVTETIHNHGRIDVLINSAGVIKNGSVETTTLDDWDRMMHLNLRAVFLLTQKFAPHLAETRGNIVNVSSVAGTRVFPNLLAYCVSKAALDQFTRCTALELAPKRIRVNAVNPGVVVTNLHRRGGMEEDAYEAFLENSKNTHPIGRVGTPDEVAELIFYLASDKAGWITGATYAIDGGRAQTCAR